MKLIDELFWVFWASQLPKKRGYSQKKLENIRSQYFPMLAWIFKGVYYLGFSLFLMSIFLILVSAYIYFRFNATNFLTLVAAGITYFVGDFCANFVFGIMIAQMENENEDQESMRQFYY